ncbi:MAG: TonB-dependent receptor [Bacteroidaceae bacterium]
MKINKKAILMVLALYCLNLTAFAQNITLKMSNISVKEAMNELKTKSGYSFVFSSLDINTSKKISVSVENKSINEAIQQIIDGQQLTYTIEGETIILKKKAPQSATDKVQAVKGTVRSTTGEPIIGASVVVEGTTNGTITDFDGNFSLKAPVGAVVKINYLGYIAQQITVSNATTALSIVLAEDMQKMDEVVVVGYGKMKKGDLSAAVASVSNIDGIKDRPISNAAEMLQGQIPGVTVISNGGHPDAEPTITIRGMGSRNGESPLYVVDGVPGAPFNFSDVTSMTVLKDAASAAIYGAYAGSAGVILVTTKQAVAGKTTVEYNAVYGVSTASNLPQSLTIDEERSVRAAALGGEQNLPDGWDVSKNPYIGETRTDWIDAIFRTAAFQRHNIAISGGTEEFSNRASFEYSDRQGTLVDTYKKSTTLRLNSMWKINKYMRVRQDINIQDVKLRGADTSSAETGIITSALKMPRNAEIYTANGSYGGTAPSDQAYIQQYGSNYADIHGDAINPLRLLSARSNYNHLNTLTSSTFFDIMEPIKGLNFTSRFTYKLSNYFERYSDTRRLEPGKPHDLNILEYTSYRAPEWSFENTVTYDRIFNRHNLGLMASTTANEYTYRNFSVTGHDFDNEETSLMYFSQAGMFDSPEDGYQKDRNVSVVGRASYSYADRYFMTASWRRDYAGRLPKGEKYGYFPSATVAWKLTSEPFMPKLKNLNVVKLRASWGKIGNLGSISRGYGYALLSPMYTGGSNDIGSQIGINNTNYVGIYNSTGFNPNLTWETSEQIDLGLDMVMFDNRLSVTADYFVKRTKDLIKEQDAGWTNSIGINPMLINEGEITNSGLEVSASWQDKIGNVNYWVSGNVATLKNTVENIGAADGDGNKPVWTDGGSYKDLYPYRTEEGQPLFSYYLIKSNGVFKTQQEVDAHVNAAGQKIQPDAQVGDLMFMDTDGDGKITAGDKEFMGNAMPKVTYSLAGGLTWKNFTFNMMLQGVSGVKLFNAYKFITLNESLGSFNRSREILQALNGPSDEVPRISSTDANGNFSTESDYYLEDGDYLRIKNISVGYSFTKLFNKFSSLAKRKSTLDLTLSVDNLATFTNYSGIDPEVGGTGLDTGQYPVSRTYSIALKLKF